LRQVRDNVYDTFATRFAKRTARLGAWEMNLDAASGPPGTA